MRRKSWTEVSTARHVGKVDNKKSAQGTQCGTNGEGCADARVRTGAASHWGNYLANMS